LAYFSIEGYNSYSGCDITVTASLPPINGKHINKYYSLGSLQTLSISTHQDKRPVRSLGVINAKDYVMGPRTIAGSMVFAVFNKHFATEIMNDLGAEGGANVILPDEIPALNITVNFANEYGRMSRMAIYGVKIINEGQVMSINDLYTENTYQFVALGLEPLNININTNGTLGTGPETIEHEQAIAESNPYKNTPSAAGPTLKERSRMTIGYLGDDAIIEAATNSTTALLNDKYFTNNSGVNIADKILNNPEIIKDNILEFEIQNKHNPIELSVSVAQPTSPNDNGIASFTLKPTQVSGVIYIYPLKEVNIENEYTIIVANRRNLSISLPVGKYKAQYANEKSETSNMVDFTIEKYVEYKTSDFITNYPIIEKVTDSSITVSSPDYNYDTVYCFEEGKQAIIVPIGKKSVKISSLKPSTEYNIFMINGNDSGSFRSQTVTVKTYFNKDKELEMLKEYIKFNKNLLLSINDSDDEIFANINYEDYNTLIDMVLDLPENIKKQELLIYATELTNQLNTSHNIDNTIHINSFIQENPFTSVITVNNFDSLCVYKNNNNKAVLDTVIDHPGESFCVKPNKHYSVIGIDQGRSKSVKKSFTVCKNNYRTELDRYCEVENYKSIDLTEYENRYIKNSLEVIEAMAIKNNLYSDIDLLPPPYIYQEDKKIYADINYLNLNMHDTYYLCCSELYAALDYFPIRKIKFSLETALPNLNLKDYYLGMVPDKKYLFWIEDSTFMKISKPYLFVDNNTSEFNEFNNIYKDELSSKLASLKKEMMISYGNQTVIYDLFDYVASLQPDPKNFDAILISEMINRLSSSYYVTSTIVPLFELMKIIHTYNTIKNLPKITMNKETRTITFGNIPGYYVCAIEFNTTEDINTRLVNETENVVRYGTEGFTYIYLISNHMIYKSGFIIIDNENNIYRCTNDLLEVIEEVGDK
jgi:hypothetical protein